MLDPQQDEKKSERVSQRTPTRGIKMKEIKLVLTTETPYDEYDAEDYEQDFEDSTADSESAEKEYDFFYEKPQKRNDENSENANQKKNCNKSKLK